MSTAARLRICVTGGTGKIGCSFLQSLACSDEVSLRALACLSPVTGHPGVEWLRGDLGRMEDCQRLIEGQDVLVHLAWRGSPLAPGYSLVNDAEDNLVVSLRLLEAVRRSGRRMHVVFCSSGGTVYGECPIRQPFRETDPCRPLGSYSIQKLAVEQYLQSLAAEGAVTATILRVATGFGWLVPPEAAQGFVGVALSSALQNKPIRLLGDPTNVRDYIFVDDICNAVWLACHRREGVETFNIGCGIGYSVIDVIREMEQALGRKLETYSEDWPAARLLPPWSVLNVSLAREAMGWTPRIALGEGIRLILDRSGYHTNVAKQRLLKNCV